MVMHQNQLRSGNNVSSTVSASRRKTACGRSRVEGVWGRWCLTTTAVFLLLMYASGGQPGRTAHAAERSVPVCLLIPVFNEIPSARDEYPGRIAHVFSQTSLRWAAAALRGVEHVNSRDCSVVGGDCAGLVDNVKIHPMLYDIHDFSPRKAPSVALDCFTTGAQFVVSTTTSEQTNYVAAIASGLGRFLISSYGTSHAFSNKANLYKNFARTTFNSAELGLRVALLVQHFGWQQVAVMHNVDLYGSEYAETFTSAAKAAGLEVQQIPLAGRAARQQGRDSCNCADEAAAALRMSGIKVVVLVTFPDNWHEVLKTTREEFRKNGEDYRSLVWISAVTSTLDTLMAVPEVAASDPELDELFNGILGISVESDPVSRQRLQDDLQINFGPKGFLKCAKASFANAGIEFPVISEAEVARVLGPGPDNILDDHAVHAYDLAWTMAAVIAAASRKSPGSNLTGDLAMSVMRERHLPVFHGAYGVREFTPQGDWDLNHSKMIFTNYALRPGDIIRTHVRFASIDTVTGEITDEDPVVWANGMVYPQIPSDGHAESNTMLHMTITGISLLAAVAATIIAICAIVVLAKRSWLLKRALSGPPQEGEMVTLVTTDIHGSTTLWDAYPEEVAKDIALHHEVMRAHLKECCGYEIATEGDSFKCAFKTPEDAIAWSVLVQLNLLCAPWSNDLEDGGHSLLQDQPDWANCMAPPVIDQHAQDVITALGSSDKLEAVRSDLEKGAVMEPSFDPRAIADSPFCLEWKNSQELRKLCVVYGKEGLCLPLYRGPRVRIGIHTGVAESVEVNPVTKRIVYGGQVAELAKAVSDAPCGGQIVVSGETLAAVASMQDLLRQVSLMCAGWRSADAAKDCFMPAGLSVMSLGSHLLKAPKAEPEVMMRTFGDSSSSSFSRQSSRDPSQASEEQLHQQEMVQNHFKHAHELIMVVPWTLRARALYCPPVKTHKMLTNPWSSAPSAKDITILFMFLEGSIQLKQLSPGVARQALEQLQAAVRSELYKHNGYEVEVEEGSFVCAFHEAMAAVQFSLDIQVALMGVQWAPEILSHPWALELVTPTGGLAFKGLRLSVGMCSGDAMRVQPCLRTGKMEYFGPIMNHAARVAVTAHGGQVLLHEKTWEKIKAGHEGSIEDSKARFISMGDHALKGVKNMTRIIQRKSLELRPTLTPHNLEDYLAQVGATWHAEEDDSGPAGHHEYRHGAPP